MTEPGQSSRLGSQRTHDRYQRSGDWKQCRPGAPDRHRIASPDKEQPSCPTSSASKKANLS